MMTSSARYALPLLQPGQAQKELYHNEALALLDIAVHPVVEDVGRNDPPVSAEPGQTWIVGAAPTGDWLGVANHLAGMTSGGWRHVPPQSGMYAWSIADGCYARWDGVEWKLGELVANSLSVQGEQVVGSRQPAVPIPAGGGAVDVEARAAISAVISALSAHGLIHS